MDSGHHGVASGSGEDEQDSGIVDRYIGRVWDRIYAHRRFRSIGPWLVGHFVSGLARLPPTGQASPPRQNCRAVLPKTQAAKRVQKKIVAA